MWPTRIFEVVILISVVMGESVARQRLFSKSDGSPLGMMGQNGASWTSSSEVTCAIKCLSSFTNCHSFLYNRDTKLCQPGSWLSFQAAPPSAGDGTLLLSNPCDQSAGFMATWLSPGQGICVYVSDYPAVYADVKQICTDKGGFVYSVQTQEKHDLLMAIVQAYPTDRDIYIGLTEDVPNRKWYWDADGTEIDSSIWSTVWHPGEPNYYVTPEEDCVSIRDQHSYLGLDVSCFDQRYFICETDLT